MYIDPTRYSGRPADCASRLPKEQRCYDLLDGLGVAYTRVDHDFADTIEACEAVEAVLGEKICKNLFLCNRQKTQFYLLMLEGEIGDGEFQRRHRTTRRRVLFDISRKSSIIK